MPTTPSVGAEFIRRAITGGASTATGVRRGRGDREPAFRFQGACGAGGAIRAAGAG